MFSFSLSHCTNTLCVHVPFIAPAISLRSAYFQVEDCTDNDAAKTETCDTIDTLSEGNINDFNNNELFVSFETNRRIKKVVYFIFYIIFVSVMFYT